MSIYVCTLFVERSNALVRIDVLEPHGLMSPRHVLKVSTTLPDGTVEVEHYPLDPPGKVPLHAVALAQTLNCLTHTERGGGYVTYVHSSPDFDPTAFDPILSGVNLAHDIIGLQTTRTVQ